MLWVTDKSTALIYPAQDWERFCGQSVEDAKGKGWLAKVHADDRAMASDTLQTATSREKPFTRRFRISRPEGGYRWVASGGSPALSPTTSKFIGYLGTVEEVCFPELVYSADARPVAYAAMSETALTGLDKLADLVIEAREIAMTEKECGLVNILDLALFEVGFRLADAIKK